MNHLSHEDFNQEVDDEDFRKKLPIFKYKDEIIKAVKENQIVIIHGQTGCGKTTQVPQYLYESDMYDEMIGVTQPRKIAVTSMAKRVAQEMHEQIGKKVGFEIRFEKNCSASTKIKYMTDGILLNECIMDKELKNYSVVMIDEAHERSVNSDVLLGLLKEAAAHRKDLKIVISSATISVQRFETYFLNAKVVQVETRMYNVNVVNRNPNNDYMKDAVEIVREIHLGKTRSLDLGSPRSPGRGDVLIFLTGQEEINKLCEELKKIENVVPMPLYSAIDFGSQKEVFSRVKEYETKVVVATNIAETSITIDGITDVLDCGYVKQNKFNRQRGMEVLEDVRISKAQAEQRKGRAGRTQDGTCYRLYKKTTFETLQPEATPEIKRKNLSQVYLILKTLGKSPKNFDFLDQPKPDELERCEKELQSLSLLNEKGLLTPIGVKVSTLPLDPILGKVLVTSETYDCLSEVIPIVAMMTENMQKIFRRPKNKAMEADMKKKLFDDPSGDHFLLLNVYEEWSKEKKDNKKKWCIDNFVDLAIMEGIEKIIKQLYFILKKEKKVSKNQDKLRDNIKKSFVSGYFRNICIRQPRDVYRRVCDNEIFNLTASCVFKDSKPKIKIWTNQTTTLFSKNFMNNLDELKMEPENEVKMEEVEVVCGKELPIMKYKEDIIEAVKNHQFVIIHGQTGCGKSTQVPQFLLKENLNDDLMIGVTQPRRLAAMSMAKRVAQEMDEAVGKMVGYEIRFDKKCGSSTKIKYMTDGILLNEYVTDPNLKDYKVIMIDEAHERSLTSDVILGLMKVISTSRKDLKVIISSATINVEKFQTYLGDSEVISVESGMFNVEVKYDKPGNDYMKRIPEIVQSIHHREMDLQNQGGVVNGHVLVFLTGQEEIYECCDDLASITDVVVRPLCSVMHFDSQKEAFEPVKPFETKVVVATNIAETSLTIEGIKYVLDCGYVKQNRYNPNRLLDILEDVRISKAQAEQRKGRAGRTQEGICYRLYSERAFESFRDDAIPEVYCKNLSETCLKLRALNIVPSDFDFLDLPKKEELDRSEKELMDLGLMASTGNLTPMGHKISTLPINPILGKVLMMSISLQCMTDVIRIIAMFSVKMQYIFDRPRKFAKEADKKRTKLNDPNGDHFTLLKVYNTWSKQKDRRKWSYDNYINGYSMEYVEKTEKQLRQILKTHKINIVDKPADQSSESHVNDIKTCFVAGFFKNICVIQPRGSYNRVFDREVFLIYGNSSLKEIKPKVILFHDAIKSSKSFASGVLKLDEDFLRKNFKNEMNIIKFPAELNEPLFS